MSRPPPPPRPPAASLPRPPRPRGGPRGRARRGAASSAPATLAPGRDQLLIHPPSLNRHLGRFCATLCIHAFCAANSGTPVRQGVVLAARPYSHPAAAGATAVLAELVLPPGE